MRICLVAQHDPGEFLGGTEMVVRAQMRALAELGHEPWLVAGSDTPHAGVDALEGRLDALRVVRLPRLAHESYSLELDRPRLRELARAAARGADVVHVHHWATLDARLVTTLAEIAPVVVTLHDFLAVCPRFFRRSPVAGLACPERGDPAPCARCLAPDAPGLDVAELERRLAARARAGEVELAHAAQLVAPSRAHAGALERLLGLAPGSIRVVPHGVCRPLARDSRPRRRVEHPLRVLHFGNLSQDKGTLDLVRALAALPPGAAELELLGPALEPGLDDAIEAARGGLPVRRRGAYAEETLAAAAARADLAAFPSRLTESYGLAVDESLALGLPAWVSDRGAPAERVGAAGRALPAEDPAAWTRAFGELRSRPAMLDEQRQAIPARVRTALDAARELAQIYAAAAGQGARA